MTAAVGLYGEESRNIEELMAALSAFQGVMANVPRKTVGEFGKYADLADIWSAVRKPLADNGLCIITSLCPLGQAGDMACVTTLGHKSGQFVKSICPMPPMLSPQALAAYTTYARRIAMASLLGIAADDEDDGATAEKAHHQFVSASDRKWFEKARKALSEAEGDAEKVSGIYKLCDEGVKKGQMSTGSKEMLMEEFPVPKEVAIVKQ
jgi:ERF superfamily